MKLCRRPSCILAFACFNASFCTRIVFFSSHRFLIRSFSGTPTFSSASWRNLVSTRFNTSISRSAFRRKFFLSCSRRDRRTARFSANSTRFLCAVRLHTFMCEQSYTVGGRGWVGFTTRGGGRVACHSQTAVSMGVTGVCAAPCCFQQDPDGRFQRSEQHQRDVEGPTFRDATACRQRTGGKAFPGGRPPKGTAWHSTFQVQRHRDSWHPIPEARDSDMWADIQPNEQTQCTTLHSLSKDLA
jgi:hypothetical protein